MNGILLIDKPSGWTSSDVVAKLRGILRERRVGHSGTLDPMATGLLVVFGGRATRAVECAENHEAIKVGGKKLYEIARRGGQVERRPRPVCISELRYLGREGEDVLLDVRCSKGTYIRTLCHDLGEKLGCGGCMSALRRLQAGSFLLENAFTLDQVQAAADRGEAGSLLLPVDSLFAEYPALAVDAGGERRIRSGAAVPASAEDGTYRVFGPDGAFLALASVRDGELRCIKSFFEV